MKCSMKDKLNFIKGKLNSIAFALLAAGFAVFMSADVFRGTEAAQWIACSGIALVFAGLGVAVVDEEVHKER